MKSTNYSLSVVVGIVVVVSIITSLITIGVVSVTGNVPVKVARGTTFNDPYVYSWSEVDAKLKNVNAVSCGGDNVCEANNIQLKDIAESVSINPREVLFNYSTGSNQLNGYNVRIEDRSSSYPSSSQLTSKDLLIDSPNIDSKSSSSIVIDNDKVIFKYYNWTSQKVTSWECAPNPITSEFKCIKK